MKTNKSHTNIAYLMCVIHVQEAELCFVFFFLLCFPSLSLSLQLALRAPLSLFRGQDYVSNVHSTVAPPSRPPPSAVVGTATTAETWTNRRTCAPVSQSLSVKQTQKCIHAKPLSSVAERDCASGWPRQVCERKLLD